MYRVDNQKEEHQVAYEGNIQAEEDLVEYEANIQVVVDQEVCEAQIQEEDLKVVGDNALEVLLEVYEVDEPVAKAYLVVAWD